MSDAVDWGLASVIGARLAPTGPTLPREDVYRAVQELGAFAHRAVPIVAEAAQLQVPADGRIRVVDRPTWIAANVSSMGRAIAPVLDLLDAKEPPALVRGIGERATAVELGAVLAWLSGKVLGQYDVFGEPAQLLLVAPTIVQVERSLGVIPEDFRLWVCLHEETHRVQFGAVPWLRDHLISLIAEFAQVSDFSLGDLLRALARAVDALRRPDGSVVEAVQTPEQRIVFARITAFMSLLEGHADVIMDAVGPQVVPSVAFIRERFTKRREQPSAADALARRALGLDAKLRQYSDGALFVRAVVEARGIAGFNAVWAGPHQLPSLAEIHDPTRWLDRVPG